MPIEPAKEMLDAAAEQFLHGMNEYHNSGAKNIRPFCRFYKAMIATAPENEKKE